MKLLYLTLLASSCTLYEIKGSMNQENFEKEVKMSENQHTVPKFGDDAK